MLQKLVDVKCRAYNLLIEIMLMLAVLLTCQLNLSEFIRDIPIALEANV
jgi:hypothetical protein